MTVGPSSSFAFADVLCDGDVVAWPQGTGEPLGLTARLMEERTNLPAVTLMVGMMTGRAVTAECLDRFDVLCLNGAGRTRGLLAAGARIAPVHISNLPDLIASGRLPVDVVLVRVRPAAEPGMMSLGVVVDYVRDLIDAARVVVAEVDPRLPLTGQDALVPRTALTYLVEADCEDHLLPGPEPSTIDSRVAEIVTEMIPDRATLQFGIGALPAAVCKALQNHKGLGLHSGVLNDGAVDLIERGVVTNAHKGIDAGITVTGCLFGSRKLMGHADANEDISMRSARYTHSAAIMSRIANLHSINSAIEVDLTGQVNAEVAGQKYLGAVGGQVDFVRGAHLSPGGRSIIAMASTTPDRKRSKIVASLNGRPVTTARADVDVIITEFGRADLAGLDLNARAEALINIAHPDFREQLARSASGMTAHRSNKETPAAETPNALEVG